jgi:hypothetical protein
MAAGDALRSVLIASEPLTVDTSTWLEVPEYSMITAAADAGGSSSRRSTSMPDAATGTGRVAGSSPRVPLLEGAARGGADRARPGARRREAPAGEVLWHQGEEAGADAS